MSHGYGYRKADAYRLIRLQPSFSHLSNYEIRRAVREAFNEWGRDYWAPYGKCHRPGWGQSVESTPAWKAIGFQRHGVPVATGGNLNTVQQSAMRLRFECYFCGSAETPWNEYGRGPQIAYENHAYCPNCIAGQFTEAKSQVALLRKMTNDLLKQCKEKSREHA